MPGSTTEAKGAAAMPPVQPWEPARSPSTDSLESSGSSGGQQALDYIPTRTVGKAPKLPSHNPLQFVKVQSPLYKKVSSSSLAETQIKLTKEVKITRELKEGEEEWQSNLDNWKSRRRKVSEKVIQRAEEMRQIEAEEQLRQEQILQQQRKIKKFSEMRSSSRSYNLDLYIGQGNDSGLGGTPEPDDTLDNHSSILRSDTSEGMTSESESIDSDIHKFDKVTEKEPPKVPQKPQSRLKRDKTIVEIKDNEVTSNDQFSHLTHSDLSGFDNFSSTEPSDIEGHAGDSETISSEDDVSYLSDYHKPESDSKARYVEENGKENRIESCIDTYSSQLIKEQDSFSKETKPKINQHSQAYNLSIKPGDNRGFGFTLKGGKDQGCAAYIDSVTKYGPAETAGLKEGDKILSLNGELTDECSHASLVFSVKQAVYTGVLDIIVEKLDEKNSSTKSVPPCPEVKPKSTGKKSSFAEKLALFSSKANPASSMNDGGKSSVNSKSEDNKSESLVLRRRSAFENGKSDTNVIYRRSSCLSQGTPSVLENVEKRLSGDLTFAQIDQESSLIKKKPPPPVPVKPKLKAKTNIATKTDSSTVNGCNDSSTYVEENILPQNDSQNYSNNDGSTVESAISEAPVLTEPVLNYKNSLNVNENIHTSDSSLPQGLSQNEILYTDSTISEDQLKQPENSPVLQNTHSIDVIDELDSETINEIVSEVSSMKVEETATHSFPHISQKQEISSTLEISENNTDTSDQVTEIPSVLSNLDSSNLQFGDNIEGTKAIEIESMQSNSEFNSTYENNIYDNILDINAESDPFFCGVPENDSDNLDALDIYDESNMTDENIRGAEGIDNLEYFENNLCNTDENDESVDNMQSNPSPLCLPLEKIDEDDVISASTTTSSETPDTETVIETLPSNLSPLPNDESNGEESSKPLSCQELENSIQISVSHTYSNDTDVLSCTEILPENLNENVPISEEYSPEDYMREDDCGYSEDQEEEYNRELDESIDQITSLDVIDEIEQRLMHQLEQQDEIYDEGLDDCLDQDMNKQWLYLSEEAELLHDLTPRNMEPPREPPPPPPPPETETHEEKEIIPMVRANSTKRIKKELWRRRSDFLGLDSPEGIDVDNILPPPPGLEEILKQEREQNQWLEKRLSLAETDVSAPLYSNDPIELESQDYTTQNDFSDYYLEDTEGSTVGSLDGNIENWKESVENDSDFQSVTSVDVPSPSSDESLKNCESPQNKAKQNIISLGAAPKAKIMDSNKWITEKIVPVNKKRIEPVFSPTTYNQNYWLAQDDERKKTVHNPENVSDRRYSMPQFSNHPDVTVRTWGDRENEFQKQRPRSAVWDSSSNNGDYSETYYNSQKQDVVRTHSLDSRQDMNCDSNILESEVHNCSCCGKGLCEGSAMGIEALRLYFHIECFRCCLCRMQLGNGLCGIDVQVKNNKLFCPRCFTVD